MTPMWMKGLTSGTKETEMREVCTGLDEHACLHTHGGPQFLVRSSDQIGSSQFNLASLAR